MPTVYQNLAATAAPVCAGERLLTAYTGTVGFTSSDPYPGVLPASYTFTSSDQGIHTFNGGVTLFTAGAQTRTVQDSTDSSIMGSVTIAVSPSSASSFLLPAPPTAVGAQRST
jgi:hypothetical protein